MTAQYTNSIQFLVANTTPDLASSSSAKTYNDYDPNGDVFSAALDNATKSYADKSENKVSSKDNDYAKDTKDLSKTDTKETKQEIDNQDSQSNQIDDKNQSSSTQEVKSEQSEQTSTEKTENQTDNNQSTTDSAQQISQTQQQNAVTIVLTDTSTQNAMANEQLLSNIEGEIPAETTQIKAAADISVQDVDAQTLKQVQENAQLPQQKENRSKDAVVQSVKNSPENHTDVKPAETSAVAITPADTEAEKAPVIKVTQEVAANTKENSLANAMENKDTTSKIKDKAVAQMTALEDTNTVVTQSSTADTSSQQQNGTLNGNNAQEQIMKMSVEANSDVTAGTLTGTETFASKMDVQLSAAAKTSSSVLQNQLNQSSILEQVNKQFEQLQQTGNNKVSIVLQPENLGRVSVEIMNSKDGITAKMLTDNQQVKDLFDKNIEALKSNLSSQGVNVNNIKVECTQESANNAMNFERDQFSQSFDNPHNSNNHNQTNQSNSQTSYTMDTSGLEDSDIDVNSGVEIKNTQTIIQHNGKVDYKV